MHEEYEFLKRLTKAAKDFEENLDDENPWKVIDRMDKERERLMLKAEKKCRTGHVSEVQCSETVNKEGQGFCSVNWP